MKDTISSNERYAPVARAIDFLVAHKNNHPSLEDVASHCSLSSSHFQRLFKAGTGVSPKRFLQYLAAGRAREALEQGKSVLEASFEAGLSGPLRLHDLVIVAEAMKPGSVRKKGAGEVIYYDTVPGPFGETLIGATDKGICWLSFITSEPGRGEQEMREDWPGAKLIHDPVFIAPLAAAAFSFTTSLQSQTGEDMTQQGKKPGFGLHVKGSNFQLKVWEALLHIPPACLMTYGDVAQMIGKPKASRAVGSAVGANMISLLIPCHRVILSSGVVHNYRWGKRRKEALLAMEAAGLSSPYNSHQNGDVLGAS